MAVSYKKLWKLLIDKDMKKKICVQKQELVLPRLLKWGETAMSLQRAS